MFNISRLQEISIIQGGMGLGVSSWRLASAVAQYRCPDSKESLGVVSLTGVDLILHRRIHKKIDPDHIRRALSHFPNQEIVDSVLGYSTRINRKPFPEVPDGTVRSEKNAQIARDLAVLGAFVEVFLAKEGHDGHIGVNLLTKIQEPTMPTLLGAIMAGANVLLMGAGIPQQIPAILDALATNRVATQRIECAGGKAVEVTFDPTRYCPDEFLMKRPAFLPIITTEMLAKVIARRWPDGAAQGFVIENPTAGGHNAGPRVDAGLDNLGQPIYGERDWIVQFDVIRGIGLPFWLAGSFASPAQLQKSYTLGANGIQVGTAFAYSEESGFLPEYKRAVIADSTVEVFTDALASPTGYPFKVAQILGTLSEPEVYQARPRNCDLGYLREPFIDEAGKVRYRCPSEPINDYLAKGGELVDTVGRKCICNGLTATIGLRHRDEPAVVTSGDDLEIVRQIHKHVMQKGELSPNGFYFAKHVLDYLFGM